MRKSWLALAFICSVSAAVAQKKSKTAAPVQKKVLTHAVYDRWNDLPYKSLTPDGTVAVFLLNPQDGDGKAIIHNLKTNSRDSISRAENISLTFDSHFAIAKIKPPIKLVKDLRRQKKKKEELPKDSLVIFSFGSRKAEKVPEVRSYRIPEKAGGWLAYQKEAPKEEKPKAGETKAEGPKKPVKKKKNSEDNGFTLVLKNMTKGTENSFSFVKDYTFSRHGQGLMFASTGNDSTMKSGVYWYDLASEKLQSLYEGKNKYKYKGLSISEDGTQAAFLVDPDTTKALIRHVQLHLWTSGDPSARLLDIEHSMGIPQNWTVSEHSTPMFSRNGEKLFFGSAPLPVVQDTTLLPEEIVSVEIWRGEDDFIYPQQNKQLEIEKRRSYTVALNIKEKKIMQLGDREVPSIETGDEGNANVALGESNVPYRKMITWDPSAYSDFYLFDLQKQERKTVVKKVKGNASLAPKANFVYWFSLPDTAWFVYSVASEQITRMNQGMKISFADEENDNPDYPNSYGSPGWTADDRLFLVYDRYDIWAFDPLGKQAPVNLTKSGRQEKTVYRYVRLDPEERFIDPAKDLLLSAFNEKTKASGYYKLNLGSGKLTKLILDNYRFSGTVKARNADRVLFNRESFHEFPDIWSTDMNFASPKKISSANPQMKEYLWGSVEMVSWMSLDNIPLQGLLYKPEGFDPNKKYPMIVNFYEKESDNLHMHYKPWPHRSTVNRTMYTSNGYLLFIPDIVYRVGFPGESAENCVLPGVTSLIAKGFVDEKNIGVQGHSWGGYQIAYLVTRTNMFRAAEAGAVVANMISAYGGIRWESGLSRMFQYEHSQSRIGGTLWERPMLYIENSPIFFADKIRTPMLLLHNDADGAVPWYQGIEMYMALRRLNKPVWMLNYNGEPHWPDKRENRIDFQTRMMQYFDHYLKGAPAPAWMEKGIPAIEKGITKGY